MSGSDPAATDREKSCAPLCAVSTPPVPGHRCWKMHFATGVAPTSLRVGRTILISLSSQWWRSARVIQSR